MRRRSRRTVSVVVALALAITLGVTAIAWGDGASDNVSTTTGKIKPKQLPKRKFHKASLFVQSETEFPTTNDGLNQEWSEKVFLDFDDDIRFKTDGPTPCNENDIAGTTTTAAKATCPDSIIGSGEAHARVPGYPTTDPSSPHEATDFTVTAFDGFANKILLHTYSPTVDAGAGGTGATAQIVVGRVVNSPLGGDYEKRLKVSDVPDVASDVGGLTFLNATIKRGKYITARCHDQNHKFNFKEKWVYDDNSVDTDKDSAPCTVA